MRSLKHGAVMFGGGPSNNWTTPTISTHGQNAGFNLLGTVAPEGLGTFLGWFDTAPDDKPPSDRDGAAALAATKMHRGACTLRVRLANPVTLPGTLNTSTRNPMASPPAHAIAQLFVVGFDGEQRPAVVIPDEAADGMWTTPTAQAVGAPQFRYRWQTSQVRHGKDANWLMGVSMGLRPVLDLMPYACSALGWASFDLKALAGGMRYVAAFIRPATMLVGGVDELATLRPRLLWSVDDEQTGPLRDWRWSAPIVMSGAAPAPMSTAWMHSIAPPQTLTKLYAGFAATRAGAVCRLTEDFGGSAGRTVDITTTGNASTIVTTVAESVAWPVNIQAQAPAVDEGCVGMLHLWGTF